MDKIYRHDKQAAPIQFIAPVLEDGGYSNAYILGNIVWLLMHSEAHRPMPLSMMPSQIFPALAHKQYVLGMLNHQPVFYLAWANFDAETEKAYLADNNLALTPDNWNNGDRPWILFVAGPFGHLQAGLNFCRDHVFASESEVRWLYHLGKKRGERIIRHKGRNVALQKALDWQKQHPLPETASTPS